MIKCKVCKYWDRQIEDKGLCRVLPPTHNDALGKAMWPLTLDIDSCGQGEPHYQK